MGHILRRAACFALALLALAARPLPVLAGDAAEERLFPADGFDVVSYDARGHGRSTGESTLGDLEQHDVAAAVALARTRSSDVVLVGASMGAIAALRYAATDPELRGVVAVSCPARWTRSYGRRRG